MTIRWLAAFALLSLIGPSFAMAEVTPTTEDEKTLYMLGQAVGRTLDDFSLTPAELSFVEAGIRDKVLGKPAKASGADDLQRVTAMRNERLAVKSSKFLAEQAAAEGAKVQESGIIITELAPGTGESPTPEQEVKVHYHGTLPDGSVFDSSVDRGEPATFPLNRVIPCWTEGVGKMKVGGKARLVCPPNLAYGDRGAPPRIPPGTALVFEVELIEIVK